MAKAQKRSNREVRKPKAAKDKAPVALAAAPAKSAVGVLMAKPKVKL